MELHFIYLSLCWLSIQAAYVTRMTPAPRMRAPVAFRPGVSMRPWMNQRIMAAATRRAPYILYRTPMHRFAKPYPSSNNNQHVRHVYSAGGPWKTTPRSPFSASPEYDFKPSASSPARSQSDGGAIHTIPAPNLSLSEKPIIVLDGKQNLVTPISVTTELPKLRPNYEVTEKLVDPFRFGEKVIQAQATPVGFSKPGMPQSDLSTLIKNNLALQLASEYGLSAFALPAAGPGLPQEIQIHNLQNIQIPNTQEIVHPGFDSIFIPPSALYQPDQAFLQKLQSQLFERFPSVEFVPYQTQSLPRPQSHVNFQVASPISSAVFTTSPSVQTATSPLQNVVTHQPHLSVLPVNSEQHKNVVRETQESVVTLLPQIAPENVTENQVEIITASQARNLTVPIPVLVDVTPVLSTTTVKYTETSTENTSPVYYPEMGQTVGNIVANSFFSALNDVRAAAALAQDDQNKITPEFKTENASTTTDSSSTTTTMNPDLQNYFVKSIEKDENNQTVAEVKPLLGVPFAKPEPIRVEYSVIRTDDKSQKVNKDGTVYAGQIVQSSISEDHEYNKLKADLHSRRPPLRLVDKEAKTSTPATKLTVVKAKIPPRSKLTFDEKTGEPILRIYASYVDSPLHKDMIASKIANIKHVKEFSSRNQDVKSESYKGSQKSLKKLSSDAGNNQVTEFGLKLRSRVDDIVPIFDEYEQ